METRKLFVPLTLFLLLGLIATVTFGCWNMPQERSTADYVKENRNVGDFSRLEIGGAFKLYISQGDKVSLTIEADQDDIKDIITEIEGNTLRIYPSRNWGNMFNDVTIWLTIKDLEYINFSGAVEVTGEGTLEFSEIDLEVSGAAEIRMNFNASKFDAEFSGASEVDLAGKSTTGYIELSGASEFDAQNLEFQDLNVDVSGASSAKVWATGTLTIDASGASDIRYKGSPKVSLDESGASTVKPM